MGMALFAVNPLAERTIDREVEEQNLHNLRYAFADISLSDETISELRSVENVREVRTSYVYRTEMICGAGTEDVRIIGVDKLKDMKVDRIIKVSGDYPEEGELLSERWNEKNRVFEGGSGSVVEILNSQGSTIEFTISGIGKSLAESEGSYDSSGEAVFYTEITTVHALSNSTGINSLSVDLHSTDDQDLDRSIRDIWVVLSTVNGIESLEQTPEIRKDGEWPGEQFLEIFMTIMYVLTVIAVLCSIFFIYNTMNTIISEQRKEVAMMKAIGATKLQILRSFLTTSMIMGVIGSVIGTLLGSVLTYILLIYFGGLLGFDAVFSLHIQTAALSLSGGILIVVLSSLPAVMKTLSVRTREGLEDAGLSSAHRKGVIDRILIGSQFLPRPLQLGIRNSSRKKGRSIATILQVSLAVGIFLGLVSFGLSVSEELESTINNVEYDIVVTAGNGNDVLPQMISGNITNTQGVDLAEPYLETMFTINGMEIHVLGYQPDTEVKLHERTLEKGYWLSDVDGKEAVIGKQLAGYLSISVGDMIEVMTARGPTAIEIIGIDSDFYYMGMILYMPLRTVQLLSNRNNTVSGFHVISENVGRASVDRISLTIEEELEESGFKVETDKKYRIVEGAVDRNRSIINMMTATSLIIVLISLVGLTSNLTMNILERTREIGVMRCIGSVSSRIRIIFSTEVLALSLAGWILGIPMGYLIARTLSLIIDSMLEWEIGIQFPLRYIIMGLFIVMIGTLLVAQLPILRATRIRPGDALRYQ